MFTREKTIQKIFDRHTDAVFITNTGYISRAVYDLFPDNKNIFYMQGSMGLAPCMHLGITHTIAEQKLKNLFVYVLDNGCHESVGEFDCVTLENSYPGINQIFKISNDGKKDRVGLDTKKNTKQIKELF